MTATIATRTVQTRLLNHDGELPLLVEPPAAGETPSVAWLAGWAQEHRAWIDQKLLHHGAILFRGFQLDSEADFSRVFQTVAVGERLGYVGGNSPRERVAEGVYTSTSYPAPYEIPLHNEMSYANAWPRRICFFCLTPAQTGGETPIGSSAQILRLMPHDVRERFASRRVRYVQHLHGGWGLGKSWQQVFSTEDRSVVEEFCRDAGIECGWRENGALDTTQTRDAIIKHPETHEEVWFNQVDQWHPTSHSPKKLASLLKFMDEDELPHNAFWGDGSPIDAADLEAVRDVYRQVEVCFSWERGDLLLLDNILVAHARKPFEGPRTILVSMS